MKDDRPGAVLGQLAFDRYTLSASGFPLTLRQTVIATRFSQIQDPDAPILCEKWRLVLAPTSIFARWRPNRSLVTDSNPSPFANTPVPARSPTASRDAAVIFARPIP